MKRHTLVHCETFRNKQNTNHTLHKAEVERRSGCCSLLASTHGAKARCRGPTRQLCGRTSLQKSFPSQVCFLVSRLLVIDSKTLQIDPHQLHRHGHGLYHAVADCYFDNDHGFNIDTNIHRSGPVKVQIM